MLEQRGETRPDIIRPVLREGVIMHVDPSLQQLHPKMPHRREEEHQAGLMTTHVSRLLVELRHRHVVLQRIEPLQRGDLQIQLIAENQNEVSHRVMNS